MAAQRPRVTHLAISLRFRWINCAASAALSVAISGCTLLSLEDPAGRPDDVPAEDGERSSRPRGESPSGASESLLAQSRADRAAGNYARATASLERAVRIDPNNAILWVELAELHLQTGNSEQAALLAQKALALAAGENAVESRAERVLRATGNR
jgi:tetratricopeptide (TPR) repeat protein